MRMPKSILEREEAEIFRSQRRTDKTAKSVDSLEEATMSLDTQMSNLILQL